MKKPKAIHLFLDTVDLFEALTDEEIGKVIKALLCYAQTGQEQAFSDDPAARIVYIALKGQIQRDFEKYRRRCEINAQNGKKGGAPIGNQNARRYENTEDDGLKCSEKGFSSPTQPKTTETTQYENENKNENENENEHEYENENENEEENKYKEREENKKEQPQNGCSAVVSLFRRICPDISVDRADDRISADVIEQAKALLNGDSFESLFKKVQRSDFLTGRSGKWKGCSLSWVLATENLQRIRRGVYDNPRSCFSSGVTTSIDYSKHKSLFDE